jgi:hypothetical protein
MTSAFLSGLGRGLRIFPLALPSYSPVPVIVPQVERYADGNEDQDGEQHVSQNESGLDGKFLRFCATTHGCGTISVVAAC